MGAYSHGLADIFRGRLRYGYIIHLLREVVKMGEHFREVTKMVGGVVSGCFRFGNDHFFSY